VANDNRLSLRQKFALSSVTHCSYCKKPLTGPPEYGSFCGEDCATDSNTEDWIRLHDEGLSNLLAKTKDSNEKAIRCPACSEVGTSDLVNFYIRPYSLAELQLPEEITLVFLCKRCESVFNVSFIFKGANTPYAELYIEERSGQAAR
jgi:hypothetical protein